MDRPVKKNTPIEDTIRSLVSRSKELETRQTSDKKSGQLTNQFERLEILNQLEATVEKSLNHAVIKENEVKISKVKKVQQPQTSESKPKPKSEVEKVYTTRNKEYAPALKDKKIVDALLKLGISPSTQNRSSHKK